MKRALWPVAWALLKIGRTGYAMNQFFVPLHNRMAKWIKQ